MLIKCLELGNHPKVLQILVFGTHQKKSDKSVVVSLFLYFFKFEESWKQIYFDLREYFGNQKRKSLK